MQNRTLIKDESAFGGPVEAARLLLITILGRALTQTNLGFESIYKSFSYKRNCIQDHKESCCENICEMLSDVYSKQLQFC